MEENKKKGAQEDICTTHDLPHFDAFSPLRNSPTDSHHQMTSTLYEPKKLLVDLLRHQIQDLHGA